MGRRTDLHIILQNIMKELGYPENNVYFQPPTGFRIQYPCIVYSGDGGDTDYADNIPYIKKRRYQITVIDENPDSDIPDKIGDLRTSKIDRDFVSGNLNHFVYTIYY